MCDNKLITVINSVPELKTLKRTFDVSNALSHDGFNLRRYGRNFYEALGLFSNDITNVLLLMTSLPEIFAEHVKSLGGRQSDNFLYYVANLGQYLDFLKGYLVEID